MSNKFKIGDKVTSSINPHFLGQVVSIIQRKNEIQYGVSHFKDDELMTVYMYEFELEPVAENGNIGFQNS